MHCPYCGTIVGNGERKCPRCDKRIISEDEYMQLWSERAAYEDKINAFKRRVGIIFNVIFPGLGSFPVRGSLSLFLLCIPLEAMSWLIFGISTYKGAPAYWMIALPVIMRILSVIVTIKEEKDGK